jgi:hypothetical protein
LLEVVVEVDMLTDKDWQEAVAQVDSDIVLTIKI